MTGDGAQPGTGTGEGKAVAAPEYQLDDAVDSDAALVERIRRGDEAAFERPYEQYEYRERLKRMNRAANELSEEQLRLFLLHHLQNLSIQEIAGALRKSEDAIKS